MALRRSHPDVAREIVMIMLGKVSIVIPAFSGCLGLKENLRRLFVTALDSDVLTRLLKNIAVGVWVVF